MGLLMDDIHAPTVGPVASGPTSAAFGVDGYNALSLEQLNTQKGRLESELTALGAVLDSHGVNMRTSLISFDGFPRSDIDIAQVRTTRARIIHLRNDYKTLLSRIETAVHAQFAALADKPSTLAASAPNATTPSYSANSTTEQRGESEAATSYEPAFARINTVASNSPAEEAGLQPGDRVLRFGDANWLNHEKLALVARIVGRSEGRPISVQVQRSEDETSPTTTYLTLTLTPRQDWGGRGSLGCHMVAI